MLRKIRKSSQRVTLVLIGVAALSGCGDDKRRDVYATRDDCLADWGNKAEDCTKATDPRHASHGYFYGPLSSNRPGTSSSTWTGSRSSGSSRSTFSSGSSASRGGFGSSGRSSSG
jgi:hypothetical protein